ncbi:uncharacterized protein LOC134819704 [Bolinopsis microptera]|uniref:uncharacterized protein LOC134819704 n=1 Tax=Bolinopsis microptera TaxID=2820187 RepID=UPI0030795657
MLGFLAVLLVAFSSVNAEEDIASLTAAVNSLKSDVKALDMLIKFYNPEWSWSPARDCGLDCPYMVNLLDFAAVQWRFEGEFHGIFDLEFIKENGQMHGNMDFYERHMWARNCGWIKYDQEAILPEGLRTWTFAKREDGFKLYAEDQLLLNFNYTEGKCAEMWNGPTVGFFFETPATAVHLLQHGMDWLWWQKV